MLIIQEGDIIMWNRMSLKMRAKQAFRRNYWSAVAVALVMSIITTIFYASGSNGARGRHSFYGGGYFSESSLIYATVIATAGVLGAGMVVFDVFVGNVLIAGGCRFFVLNQTEPVTAGTLAYGFKSGNYGNIVLIMFLRDLFTALWSLLFIVPGIIKHYEYLMVPYIIAENPGMPREEAFLISNKMMMGQKWEAFVLDLSFIGWGILTVMTGGIVGVFYAEPYRQATFAELYSFNRAMAYQNGYIR
jgi:uncharacterized membrane protein